MYAGDAEGCKPAAVAAAAAAAVAWAEPLPLDGDRRACEEAAPARMALLLRHKPETLPCFCLNEHQPAWAI